MPISRFIALFPAHLLLLSACLLGGCGEASAEQEQQQQRKATVTTVEARQATVPVVIESVGEIRAIDDVELTFDTAGKVASVEFDEASEVGQDVLIAQLDDDEEQAELKAAIARRDRAARRLEKLEQLQNTNAVSDDRIDEAQTTLSEAEAEVARLREVLANHEVRTPFPGVLGLREVSRGAYVQQGQAVTTLTQLEPIEAYIAVPEQYLGDLESGQRVALASPAYPQQPFLGEVYRIDPRVNPGTRTVTVVARFDNDRRLLRPGMFVNVNIETARRESVVVPESAVVFEGTRVEGWVVEDGVARRRSLQIGRRENGVAEVLEGVKAGERVVTSDTERLRSGMKVEVTETDTLEALGIDLGSALATEIRKSTNTRATVTRPTSRPTTRLTAEGDERVTTQDQME